MISSDCHGSLEVWQPRNLTEPDIPRLPLSAIWRIFSDCLGNLEMKSQTCLGNLEIFPDCLGNLQIALRQFGDDVPRLLRQFGNEIQQLA